MKVKKIIKYLIPLSVVLIIIIVGINMYKNDDNITANELMENAFGKEEFKSLDADVNLELVMEADMNGMMEESDDAASYQDSSVENDTIEGLDQSDPTGFDLDDNENASMSEIKLEVNAKIKTDRDVSYLKTDMEYDVFGFTDNITEEQYIQTEGNRYLVYRYNVNENQWYKEINNDESFENADMILNIISMELFTDCEAKSTKDGYEINGTLSTEKIVELLLNYSEKDELDEVVDEINAYKFNAIIIFNADKIIKEININCENTSDGLTSVELKEFSLNVIFNDINKVTVSVPEEIMENAISDEYNSKENVDEFDIDEDNIDNNVMAYEVFGKNVVTSDDIVESISKTYMEIPDENTITAMVNMINSYTVEKFTRNLSSFNQWNDNNKMAIVYYYGLGVFAIDDLEKFGADRNYILDEYSNIHNWE